jgi:hypothetical protein
VISSDWMLREHAVSERPLSTRSGHWRRKTAVIRSERRRVKAAVRNAILIFWFGRPQCSDCGHWPWLGVLRHPAMTSHWRFVSKAVIR